MARESTQQDFPKVQRYTTTVGTLDVVLAGRFSGYATNQT